MVKDSVDKTQQEIKEEIAKALGNSGRQLESVLMQLKKTETLLEKAENKDEYNKHIDTYNELVKQAVIRREMLIIHREAVGVLKHSEIDTFYPIPGKKKKRI